MIFTRLNAIESLYPDKNLSYNSENNTCIINGEEVKDYASIDTEIKRLQAEYDAQEYARKREAEYPTIQELVVALYDTDDKADIEAKRAEVKKKYPKP